MPESGGMIGTIAGAIALAFFAILFRWLDRRNEKKNKIKIAADRGDKRRRLLGIVQERRANRDL